MDMQSEHRIEAPRDVVWEALNDPEVLARCIPGCKELVKEGEDGFAAQVVAAIGPVKATFKGRVKLNDIDPPHGYTLTGEGSGGAAGFAKASASVRLVEDDGATVLSYSVKASVGGKLAQIGSRLVEGAAKKIADQFFANFCELLTAEEEGPAEAEPAAEGPANGDPERKPFWKRMF